MKRHLEVLSLRRDCLYTAVAARSTIQRYHVLRVTGADVKCMPVLCCRFSCRVSSAKMRFEDTILSGD